MILPTLSRTTPPKWLTVLFWANLVAQAGIVVTGGLVRLTGSGLGCPTWPQCAPGSYTPTHEQEQGIHKYIEFGNRTLTGVLGFLAIALLIGIIKGAPHRKGLRAPVAWVFAGVVFQAVLGGITVLTSLNPAIVAAHFLVSMLLVAVSAWLVWRGREGDAPARPLVPSIVTNLAKVTAVVTFVVLVLGTIVTGSGPHSGDAEEPARLAFDPRSASWLHADAVMLLMGLIVAMLVAVRLTAKDTNAPRAWFWVLVVALAQGAIGYVQYFTGLPWVIVLFHMAGASILVIAVSWGMLSLRERDDLPEHLELADQSS